MFSTIIRLPPHICLILSAKLECLILKRHAVMVQMFILSSNVGTQKTSGARALSPLLVQVHVLLVEECNLYKDLVQIYSFGGWNSATSTKTWCKYTPVPPPPATQASAQMTLHQSYRSSPPLSSSYRSSSQPLSSHLSPFFLHRKASNYRLELQTVMLVQSLELLEKLRLIAFTR